MKATIFYFSGTGNTWFVAESLRKGLFVRGIDVEAMSIEDSKFEDGSEVTRLVTESDHIIIGYPIYGSVAPKPMVSFIEKLPKTYKNTKLSVFSTVALASGDGAVVYKDILENKGYMFHTGMEFKLSNNFNVPIFPDVLHVGDNDKIDKRNEKARLKAEKMADCIVDDNPKIEGNHLIGHFLGNVQRGHVDELLESFNNKLYVENSKCVSCKKCIKICPMSNINEVDEGIEFKGNCAVCMRCYHFCPTQAINVTKASLDNKKWPRYRGATSDYQKSLLEMRTK